MSSVVIDFDQRGTHAYFEGLHYEHSKLGQLLFPRRGGVVPPEKVHLFPRTPSVWLVFSIPKSTGKTPIPLFF